MKDEEFKSLYEDYKKSKFKQQKMNGWRPLPTISCITIIFVCFGVFFILMGLIIIIVISQIPEEIKYPYSDKCNCSKINQDCKIDLEIEKKMKSPIMLYYQIESKKQNNRGYMDEIKKENENGNYDDLLEDNFKNWNVSGINVTDIGDINDNIKNYWGKINPYNTVRKLLGNITRDLKANSTLNVTINVGEKYCNNKKYLILAQKSIFGGAKRYFLGSAYIVFGFLCLIASIIFINAYNKFHKKI
jgi:hypothetical protein